MIEGNEQQNQAENTVNQSKKGTDESSSFNVAATVAIAVIVMAAVAFYVFWF
jgi:hypothetical protein